jgi:hypothetical protein
LFSSYADNSVLLIGHLTQQSYCENKEWVDPHFEIGFVPVMLGTQVDSKPNLQKMVVATGTVDASISSKKIQAGNSCDQEAQSRGDWVWGKDGSVRELRDVPSWMRKQLKWNEFTTSTVRVSSIKPFSGLTAKLDGQDLVVSFANTLGQDLKDITVKAHYEGCYGKPGAAHQEKTFSLVSMNQTVVARFPIISIDEKQTQTPLGDRSQHVISSVQIVSGDQDVWFDLDASVKGDLGLPLECPKRTSTWK